MLMNTNEYMDTIEQVKQQIQLAQQRALMGANRELVVLYWNVGKIINERKTWGDKFIVNLANDVRSAFPKLKGFSERNIKYMAKFANIYNNLEIVQRVLHNLPWRHNIALKNRG